ncbi:histidine triad nucleotide-binding protein [Gelria sp. Kuro-4]|uniref:histidine triad nucleotide-binding protein n=1 Tax=Gelria sp. Kuro-4 TaxID=2796927 RepID=UPI002107D898|nr:histidine triad nucleotide-binding protein [Gelria sp. Kuro-4]
MADLPSDCIFCGIIEGKISAKVVYQDEKVMAFEDIKPIAPVHILIVPRKHIPDLTKTTAEDVDVLGHIQWVAAEIARQQGIAERGFKLVNNCRADGGQVIYHLHYHLIGGKLLKYIV